MIMIIRIVKWGNHRILSDNKRILCIPRWILHTNKTLSVSPCHNLGTIFKFKFPEKSNSSKVTTSTSSFGMVLRSLFWI